MDALFSPDTRSPKVRVGPPFASDPNEATVEIEYLPTSPGFSTGANISVRVARELMKDLAATLAEIDATREGGE